MNGIEGVHQRNRIDVRWQIPGELKYQRYGQPLLALQLLLLKAETADLAKVCRGVGRRYASPDFS